MHTTKTLGFITLFFALRTTSVVPMNPPEESVPNKRDPHTKVARRKLGANYGHFGTIKKVWLDNDNLKDQIPPIAKFKVTLHGEDRRLLDNLMRKKINIASTSVKGGYKAQEGFRKRAWDLYNDGKPLEKYVPEQGQPRNPHHHEKKEQG